MCSSSAPGPLPTATTPTSRPSSGTSPGGSARRRRPSRWRTRSSLSSGTCSPTTATTRTSVGTTSSSATPSVNVTEPSMSSCASATRSPLRRRTRPNRIAVRGSLGLFSGQLRPARARDHPPSTFGTAGRSADFVFIDGVDGIRNHHGAQQLPLEATLVGDALLEALAGWYEAQYRACALHMFEQGGATYLFDLTSSADLRHAGADREVRPTGLGWQP